jgi:rubrerythrin
MSEDIDPIVIAIQTEKDGITFYEKAAKKTSHPFGKKMFLSFIEDEKRHLEILEQISKEMDVPFDTEYSPKERVKTVFEGISDQVTAHITPTADETEAIRIALEIENEGYTFYKEQAEKHAEHSNVFERLAKEESEHIFVLQNLSDYLNDSGHWFMYGEHQMVDGG